MVKDFRIETITNFDFVLTSGISEMISIENEIEEIFCVHDIKTLFRIPDKTLYRFIIAYGEHEPHSTAELTFARNLERLRAINREENQ